MSTDERADRPRWMPPTAAEDPWTGVETRHGFRADELISTLQKEIRRGHAENAALVAYEMATTSAELEAHLWQRLMIISVEDIGFGDPQAAVLVDSLHRLHLEHSRPRFDRYLFAIHAVRYLAGCTKDRSTDEMLNWIVRAVEEDGVRPEIPDHAYCMHTKRGQELGRGFEHWFTEGARVEPERADRDRTYHDRLVERHGLEP